MITLYMDFVSFISFSFFQCSVLTSYGYYWKVTTDSYRQNVGSAMHSTPNLLYCYYIQIKCLRLTTLNGSFCLLLRKICRSHRQERRAGRRQHSTGQCGPIGCTRSCRQSGTAREERHRPDPPSPGHEQHCIQDGYTCGLLLKKINK